MPHTLAQMPHSAVLGHLPYNSAIGVEKWHKSPYVRLGENLVAGRTVFLWNSIDRMVGFWVWFAVIGLNAPLGAYRAAHGVGTAVSLNYCHHCFKTGTRTSYGIGSGNRWFSEITRLQQLPYRCPDNLYPL